MHVTPRYELQQRLSTNKKLEPGQVSYSIVLLTSSYKIQICLECRGCALRISSFKTVFNWIQSAKPWINLIILAVLSLLAKRIPHEFVPLVIFFLPLKFSPFYLSGHNHLILLVKNNSAPMGGNDYYDDGTGFFNYQDEIDWSEGAIYPQSCYST